MNVCSVVLCYSAFVIIAVREDGAINKQSEFARKFGKEITNILVDVMQKLTKYFLGIMEREITYLLLPMVPR